jgi:nucleotide-binding universal stress UspA family protein
MGSRPAAAGMSTIERPAFRLVLVGVDGSDGAHRALRWTARLAQATAATVLAVHVLTYNREFARDLTLDTM